ncbi:MAG: SDR family NAD(P)-dependent oxidoreductase [Hyphomonadaceae bacterium]
MRLADQTAIVTGVSSGLGRALVRELCAQGARVVGMARRKARGAELTAEIAAAGGVFEFVEGDVSSAADCEVAAARCLDRFGRIDILINNAGIVGAVGPLAKLSEEDWDRIHNINLRGAFLMSRAVLPAMREAGDGVIIHIASQAGVLGLQGLAAYGASKAGMVMLSNAIAVENLDAGIRSNAIILGPMKSEAGKAAATGLGELARAGEKPPEKPVKRASLAVDAEPVAKSVALLCHPDARMITAAAIAIDQALTNGGAMSRVFKSYAGGNPI